MLVDKHGLSSLPPKRNFHTLLGLFTALSLSVNHVYTTETLGKELGKEQRTLCKGFTNENFKYTPVCWDERQAQPGRLMFVANHTVVDWGPHGMWLSSCSDGINSTVYDSATQIAQRVTTTTTGYCRDRGLLGWLDGGMAPSHPPIILNKQIGPEQWDI